MSSSNPVPINLLDDEEDAPQAVVFDWDGTVLRWPLFYHLFEESVAQNVLTRIMLTHVEQARLEYKRRKAPYKDFERIAVQVFYYEDRLEGVRVADLERVARLVVESKGEEVYVFTRELARAAADVGAIRAVISGSPIEVVQPSAATVGISICLGTEMERNGAVYTGKVKWQCVDKKDEAIRALAAKHGFRLDATVAIGDSMGDAKMLAEVRYPLCFKPPRELKELARKKGWPIVSEEKDSIEISRPNERGRFEEASLDDVLPPRLAQAMRKRLPFLP